MTDRPEELLEEALCTLEQLAGKGEERRRTDRYDARALLVALGSLLRERGAEQADRWLARAREATSALRSR